MNLNLTQERIVELMAIFVAQIKGATAMSRTDINRVSELVLIPLLSQIFNYENLKNLNHTVGDNYPGIDLADEEARVAFQITSSSNNEKIKDTLRKFKKYKLFEKYDRLIIYILTEKQKSYSNKGYKEITQGEFRFNVDKDILDYRDLLKAISGLQIDKALAIESILEANFGAEPVSPILPLPNGIEELTKTYIDYLRKQISTVRMFGDSEVRPLEKVFVELGVVRGYQRPLFSTDWLGLMDTVLRGLRENASSEDAEWEEISGRIRYARPGERLTVTFQRVFRQSQDGTWAKPTIKPDEFLSNETHNIIVGAPGCGKTTLLRYLVLRTLSLKEHFPILLELKNISKNAFDRVEGNFAELLFDVAIAQPLHLISKDYVRLKQVFLKQLREERVSIFLDGLDEVSTTEFFQELCRSINAFTRSIYGNNQVFVSTRPYSATGSLEAFNEFEILPLNRRLIRNFLQHYIDSDVVREALLLKFHRWPQLRELARVPFLLGVIIALYKIHGDVVEERLELYQFIVQQLTTNLDRDKAVKRYNIFDPDGTLKREFLQQLAYDRLLVDPVEKEGERLTVTGKIILDKARSFCLPGTNPYLFAADIKATPLLRELGTDTYTFAHLTIQEYLAAKQLSEREDYESVSLNAYFNSTLSEMELLPMVISLVPKPEQMYDLLEKLPDSLTYTNLRIRARGLAYTSTIGRKHLAKLIEELHRFVSGSDPAERPYLQSIIRSFSSMSSESRAVIIDHLSKPLSNRSSSVRMRAAMALGRLGDKRAIKSLANSIKDKDARVRQEVTSALGQIGDEAAIKILSKAIRDKTMVVGWEAAQALQRIGTDHALESLIRALSDKDWNVRYSAVEALGRFDHCRGTKALFKAVKDKNADVSKIAVTMLEKSDGECVVEGFQQMLKDKEIVWRRLAAEQLGKSGDVRAIECLMEVTKSDDQILRRHAAIAIAKLSSNKARRKDSLHSPYDEPVHQSSKSQDIKNTIEYAVELLIAQLHAHDYQDRWQAIKTLREIGGDQIEERLHMLIEERDPKVRLAAAQALIGTCNEHAVETFLTLLKEGDEFTRADAARNLGIFRHKKIVDALIRALKDNSLYVRRTAAESLAPMQDERAAKLLKSRLKGIDERGAIAALGVLGDRKAVKELVRLLKSKDSTTRRAVTEALGRIGTEETVKLLTEAIADSDPYVRESAAWNLGMIGSEQSIEALLKAVRDKDPRTQDSAAWTLRSIKPEVLTTGLLRALSNEDSYVRKRACQVIGYYTSDQQILKRVADLAVADTALSVRRVAKEATIGLSYKFRHSHDGEETEV